MFKLLLYIYKNNFIMLTLKQWDSNKAIYHFIFLFWKYISFSLVGIYLSRLDRNVGPMNKTRREEHLYGKKKPKKDF